jgi:diguanylate cyclase (GGDEF)-like protein
VGTRGTSPAWLRVVAAACVALCAAFAVSVIPGVRHGTVAFWDTWIYDAVSVTATTVCVGRAIARRAERLARLALGASLIASTGGDVTWSILSAAGDPGSPSLADAGWLAFYPLGYAGLVLLTRSRTATRQAGSWLDGLISGLAAASIVAALAWDTIATGAVGSPAAIGTALAYPIGDLLLVILVLGAFALTGWRPDRGLLLIGAGLLAWGAADTVYLYGTARGTYVAGGPIDLLWPLGMTLIGVGALQRPSQRRLTPHWSGVAMPAIAACAAGGVLVLSALHSGRDVAVALAGAAILAAVARTVLGLRATHALAATRELALTDELTGLPNRRALAGRLQAAIGAERPFGVLVFDLDRFKEVNDTLGHATGDEVLRRVAPQLADQLRPGDLLARLGGDEFAVVVEHTRDERALLAVADRLAAALDRPLVVGTNTARMGASFGTALHPDDGRTHEALLAHADAAMYRAKRAPRRGRSALERAPYRGELELHVQPIVDAQGRMSSAEALLRWRHPQRGLLAAADFLPLEERTHVLRAITDHVIELALALDIGVPVAINLFAADLADDALAERLAGAAGLELEIPESADVHCAAGLRETGLPIVLEGVGGRALELAARLPVRRVKLDGRFAAAPGAREAQLAVALLGVGRAAGAEVAATRLETAAAVRLFRGAGFDGLQGFAVAPPMPAGELAAKVAHPG